MSLYKNELAALLTKIESAYSTFELIRQQTLLIDDELLPLAEQNLRSAKKALNFGSIKILRYLDMVAEYQNIKIRQIEMKQELWSSLITLETLCGQPLMKLSREQK